MSTPRWNQETEFLHLGLYHFNPPYKGKLTKIKASLGNITNGCFKDKGMPTQVHKNREQFHYNVFSLKVFILQCFIVAQYIALQYEVKGRSGVFPKILKANRQVLQYLVGENCKKKISTFFDVHGWQWWKLRIHGLHTYDTRIYKVSFKGFHWSIKAIVSKKG